MISPRAVSAQRVKVNVRWSDGAMGWERGAFDVASIIGKATVVEIDGPTILGVCVRGVMIGDVEQMPDGRWGVDDSLGNAPMSRFYSTLEDAVAYIVGICPI